MGNEKIQGSAQGGVESIGVVLELLAQGLLDEGNILLVQYLAAHEMDGDAAFARLAILFRSCEVVRSFEQEPAADGYATDILDDLHEKNGEIASLARMLDSEQKDAFLKFLDKYFAAVLRDASLPPRKIYTFLSDYKDFVPHICMSYLAEGGSLIGRLGSLMKENGVEDFFERFLSSLYSVNKKAYGREALALGRYFVSVGQFERASEYLDNASYHLDELYECRFLMLCCKLRAKSEEEFVRADSFSMTMPEYVQLCVALSGHPDKMKHYSDLAHRNIEHAKTKTEATVAPKAPKKSAKRGKLAAILAALATVLGLTALLVVFVIKPVENEQTWTDLGYKKYADGLGLSSFSDGLVNGMGEVIIPEKIGGVNVVSLEPFVFSSASIKHVSLPATVTQIDGAAFAGATSLVSIEVDAENPSYVSVDGVLYTKDMTTLVAYPAAKQQTSFTVPDTVVEILSRAFDNARTLELVYIPESVRAVGSYAFNNCGCVIYCAATQRPAGWESNWDSSWGDPHASVEWGKLTQEETVVTRYYTRDGEYLYFGEYPQSLKADDVWVDESVTDARGYYLGSDGAYYAKVTASLFNSGGESSRAFSTGEMAVDGAVYYFKVEPIRWRILSEQYGKAIILCDSILFPSVYSTYLNNYAQSTVRSVLNGAFYANAFSALQQSYILLTGVDNSAQSTGTAENPCACETTLDRIFLLSFEQATNTAYGFSAEASFDEKRERRVSDYAMATGAQMLSDGSGYWWLRSPDANYNGGACQVLVGGEPSYYISCQNPGRGVVPALWIALEEGDVYVDDLGITYHLDHYGMSATVANYTGDASALTIPSALGKYSVTAIDPMAFYRCEGLERVSIPESITRISADAFFECSALTIYCKHDDIPYEWDSGWNGDCTVVWGCFDGDTDEEGIVYSFDDATMSATVTGYVGSADVLSIPSTVKGYTVTAIGENAFVGCTSLTSVTLPDSVTEIGAAAFYGCTALDSVTVPAGVSTISEGMFVGCTSLTSVTVPVGVRTVGSYAFSGCSELTGIELPEGVSSIGEEAFSGCENLENITVPEGVNTIGNRAFADCASLVSVTLPDSLTDIGEGAFSACSALASITIPEGVSSIGESVFYGCTSLGSVTMHEGVTSIGIGAFAGCSALTSVTIPDSVTSISAWAFSDCSALTSITIPDSVTSIGEYAFEGCDALTIYCIAESQPDGWSENWNSDCSVVWGCEVYTDAEGISYSLQHTSMTAVVIGYTGSASTVTIPSEVEGHTVTVIGENAFYDCTGVTSLTIPNSVTYIGYGALTGCGISSLIIPDSVTYIEYGAISGCRSLSSVEIGAGVRTIYDYAFAGCTSLTSITIPVGVTFIGEWVFDVCPGLTIYCEIESQPTDWSSSWNASCPVVWGWVSELTDEQGITYSFDGINTTAAVIDYTGSASTVTIPETVNGYTVTEILYFGGCTTLTSVSIPDSVTSIGSYAFSGCSALASIEIPSGVTCIYAYTFSDCTSLTSVSIPVGVTSIGANAFANCIGLTGIEIPNGVTSIGEYAFYQCYGLTSIEIPNGVTSIEMYAFSGCTGLSSVIIADSVTTVGRAIFNGCTDLTIYCVAESEPDGWDTYWNWNSTSTVVWGWREELTDAQGITYSVDDTTMSATVTGYTGSASTLTIPGAVEEYTVTAIGEGAFEGCTSLTGVTIPDSVTSIGEGAFSGCSSLESITLPFIGDSRKTATDMNQYPLGYIFGTASYSGGVATEQWYAQQYYSGSGSYAPTSAVYYIPQNLTSVTVTGGNILYGAFYGCTSLTGVTIPDNVTSIGRMAFFGCTGLTSVSVPESVSELGSQAFSECTSLTGVYITNLAAWCNISVSDFYANPLIYAKNLYLNGELAEDIVIPDGVSSIGDYAFYGCTSLTSVTIPDSATAIGASAFCGCTGLASVKIPDNVTTVGERAFSDCTDLTSVTIGEKVTSIGNSAFYNCNKLSSVIIPDNVSSIGSGAFSDCYVLTIYCVAESQPDGWDESWNVSGCTVVWGYTEEE